MQLLVKRWLGWMLPGVLIAAGGCYLFVAGNAQASAAIITPAPRQTAAVTSKPTKTPVRMQISSVGLDLTIRSGEYSTKTGQWSINDTDAFFAKDTVTPLIYGHNRDTVFAPISRVQKGERLQLTYADGSIAEFVYYGTRFISPSDASILTENDPHTVILFTCSGLFSDSRRIVYFKAAA